MDEKKPLPFIDIDPQKNFGGVSKSALAEKYKDIFKKKNPGEPPIKIIRHGESLMNTMPLDMSGSMGDYGLHELPHKESSARDSKDWKKELLEKSFNEKSIIIFDEIHEPASKELSKKIFEFLDSCNVILGSYRSSQEEGAALADSFQQGAAATLHVRRPLSLRNARGFSGPSGGVGFFALN